MSNTMPLYRLLNKFNDRRIIFENERYVAKNIITKRNYGVKLRALKECIQDVEYMIRQLEDKRTI